MNTFKLSSLLKPTFVFLLVAALFCFGFLSNLYAAEFRISQFGAGHMGQIECAGNRTSATNGATIGIRRGQSTTVKVIEAKIDDNFGGASITNCRGCAVTTGGTRNGEIHLAISIPPDAELGLGPEVNLRFRNGPDLRFKLAVNPRYQILTNMTPIVPTLRKGDRVTLAGNDLAAGEMQVLPTCIKVVSRTRDSVTMEFLCDGTNVSTQSLVDVKLAHRLPAEQQCFATQSWKVANFSADAKADLVASFVPTSFNRTFRPISVGGLEVDPQLCSNIPTSQVQCDRIFDSRFGTSTEGNCRSVPGVGSVLMPALSVLVSNRGGAPSPETELTVLNEQGAIVATKRVFSIQPGRSSPVVIRDQAPVTLTRASIQSCAKTPGNVVTIPFDPSTFIVKLDSSQKVDEGSEGEANNEFRF
jgi:hypothetical protein